MSRVLFFVIVLFLVWRVLLALGRRAARRSPGADGYSRFSPDRRRARRQVAEESREELVACTVCGTYVPARRALPAGDGKFVCSTACRERARSRSHADG